MTATNNTPFTQVVGDGSTTAFTYNFEIPDDASIVVYDGTTLKTLTTHYTVAGAGAENGGTVTFVTAPLNLAVITFRRSVPRSRTTGFVSNGPIDSADLNTEYDNVFFILQEQDENIGRAVLRSNTSSNTADLTLPEPTADTFLKWNAAGTGLENGNTITDVAVVAANIADINTVAANDANITTVGGNDANVTTVAGISANVTTVAGISGNVTTVAGITANIASVVADATDIGTVAASIADVNTTAGSIADVSTVATNLGGTDTIGTVATAIANVNLTGGSIANVNTVATYIANVNTTATNIADVNTVVTNIVAIQGASTEASNAATSATNSASSATSSSNSAIAAAASAASGMYQTILDKSTAYTVVLLDEGAIVQVDTSGGPVTITLDALISIGQDFKVAIAKMTGDANAVTVSRTGVDTINGGTTLTITTQYETFTFIGDYAAGEWLATGGTAAGLIAGNGITITGGTVAVKSISDSATATALTFDASQNSTFAGNITGTQLSITGNSLVSLNINSDINLDPAGTGNIVITSGKLLSAANDTQDIGASANVFANVYATNFVGSATSALYADLAEWYTTDTDLMPGQVVQIGGLKEVTLAKGKGTTKAFGIVSSRPAYTMNAHLADKDNPSSTIKHGEDSTACIGYSGRLPCLVIGKVQKGQALMVSDTQGVAMAVSEWKIKYNIVSSSAIIGRAVYSKTTEGIGNVEAAIGKM